MRKVWVYAEVEPEGAVSPTTLELLTNAVSPRDATVEAVARGIDSPQAVDTLGQYGATTVHASDDAVYDEYLAQPAAHALHSLVQRHQPNLILFATSYGSRDVAGR